MRDRSLTVATYAAGASLAAIALLYVFAPSGPSTHHRFPSKKIPPVGLANPANDCFINSVLQALAGLGELRLYLIHELHQRALDHDASVHAFVPSAKAKGLQAAIVTKGLKDMLDLLNERPLYKKTISAAPFVRTLEVAFHQRISRHQQDAQEFLQIIVERLRDEYHAGVKARNHAAPIPAFLGTCEAEALPHDGHTRDEPVVIVAGMTAEPAASMSPEHGSGGDGAVHRGAPNAPGTMDARSETLPDWGGTSAAEHDSSFPGHEAFPLEGRYQSQIQCLTCGFKPRPTESTFCTLTLNVPQVSSTTLNACFDGMFKTEYIDGFKCGKCRLLHAATMLEAELRKYAGAGHYLRADEAAVALTKLRHAITTDPENPLADLALPDMQHAPKRHIARHIRLTQLPSILAVHLSRSIFDANLSLKNSAKVAFPERLKLSSLLYQQNYRLVGLVTHRGSHSAGHYESFRRQDLSPLVPNTTHSQALGLSHVPAKPTSTPWKEKTGKSSTGGKKASGQALTHAVLIARKPTQTSVLYEPSGPDPAPRSSSSMLHTFRENTSALESYEGGANGCHNIRFATTSACSTIPKITSQSSSPGASHNRTARNHSHAVTTEKGCSPIGLHDGTKVSLPKPKSKANRKKDDNMWWRISDSKVKETSTKEVLGMRSEVFLIFYELERTRL